MSVPGDPRAPYEWADDGVEVEFVLTVCLVSDRSPAEVLELVAPDPVLTVRPAPEVRRWVADHGYESSPVEAGVIAPGWTIVVEDNGFRCSQAETVRGLSAGGRTAVSVYRNVNALCRFVVARDGVVLRDFEPLFTPTAADGPALPEEDGIRFPGEDDDDLRPISGALAVVERLTGIRLVPADLTDASGRIAVAV